jgi:hypothetical protein
MTPALAAPAQLSSGAVEAAPALGSVASDAFDRTLSGALGTADRGGAWSAAGGVAAVGAGKATLRMSARGSSPMAALTAVRIADVDLTATIELDKPQTGGGTYVSLVSRRVEGTGDYRLKLRFQSNKTIAASLVRVLGAAETTIASAPVSKIYVPGSQLQVRVRARGTSPTSLQAKVWPTGDSEPSRWLMSATDVAAGLQVPGGLGFGAYLSASATNAPMTLAVADLRAETFVTTITDGPSVTAAAHSTSSPSYSLATNVAGATYECRVDAADWHSCASPAKAGPVADGAHEFSVRAVDSEGFRAASASRRFTVDTRAPETTLIAGPEQGTVETARSAGFTFSSNEQASFQCQLDGAAWSACASSSVFGPLPYGVHTLSVRAIDEAGNVDTTPVSRTWTVVSGVPGEVKPTADNTGVPAGTKLTPYWGNLTITKPGTVIDALDVHGFVTIKAPNVTIRRSLIRGGVATGNLGLVTNTTTTATGFVIEDSTLYPDHPSVWLDAIKGSNYTARRIEASGTVDTAKVHGDNVRIESSYFHDTAYYASDPNQRGGPTHNDGVQVLGGDNITVIGNNIAIPVTQNAAIQVTQDYRAVTRLTITKNWLDGGSCTVNTNNKPLASMTGVALTSNRFGRTHKYVDCAVLSQPGVTLTASGNVWDDNGLAARLRLNG